jgi:hypothetical protein
MSCTSLSLQLLPSTSHMPCTKRDASCAQVARVAPMRALTRQLLKSSISTRGPSKGCSVALTASSVHPSPSPRRQVKGSNGGGGQAAPACTTPVSLTSNSESLATSCTSRSRASCVQQGAARLLHTGGEQLSRSCLLVRFFRGFRVRGLGF